MGVAYRLDILAWQQTEDGSKNRNRPDPPTPPTWFEDDDQRVNSTLTKAQKFLAQQRARKTE